MTSSVKCQLISLSVVLAAFASSGFAADALTTHDNPDNHVIAQEKLKVALIVSPKDSPLWVATRPLRAGIYAAYDLVKDRYELVEFTMEQPEQVPEVLNAAADSGAMLAIGPVSKSAVEILAHQSYLPLPVVAMNRIQSEVAPELMISLDMSAEGEVEQLVKIAIENTQSAEAAGKNFVIMTTDDPYDDHLARVMERELIKSGVGAERRMVSPDQLSYLRQEMRGKNFRGVFFAMGTQQASLLRPYVPPELPVFGTSYTNPMHQLDSMQAKTQSNDLAGMITLELPAETRLVLSPYAQFQSQYIRMSQDDRQMFTVGIDAWKLGEQWLQWQQHIDFQDGLSGQISLSRESGPRARRTMDKSVVTPNKASGSQGGSDEDLVQFTEEAGEAGL